MPHQLPNLQFHRDQFLALNEGFDRTGRFMFPQDWTGLEAQAWPNAEPQNLRDEKVRLETEFLQRSRYARTLRETDTFGMNEVEEHDLAKRLEKAETLRDNARLSRDQFGHVFDTRHEDASAYERRMAVEIRLCESIKQGGLDVRLGHRFGVQMNDWFLSDRFHISFANSFVIAPKPLGGRRRFLAYFAKSKFNAWALPFEAEISQYRTDSLEEQMIEWFLVYRADCLANSRKVRKEDAQAECEQYFGRNDLGRKFEAIWKLLAVVELRKVGRNKKTA